MAAATNEHGLTEKQEKFCHEFIKCGNASEAYRNSYDAGKMKTETVNRNASALLNNNKVATRVEGLRKKLAEKRLSSLEDLLDELEQARTLALAQETPQTSSAVSATMGKAKMLGYLSDKVQLSGPNGRPLDMNMTIKYVMPPSGKLPDFKITPKMEVNQLSATDVVEQYV